MDRPDDLTYHQEWRRVTIDPSGNVANESSWWPDETIARHMLNQEYPEPTFTGYIFRLETRWVSEIRKERV